MNLGVPLGKPSLMSGRGVLFEESSFLRPYDVI